MNLSVYRLLTHLGLPLFAYASWKRCKKHKHDCLTNPKLPKIEGCILSRFGFNTNHFQTNGILIHAVSVGETRSVFGLLKSLHQRHPDLPITLTNSSIQGAIHAHEFCPVPFQHQMLPFDYPFAVNRFLDQLQPKVVLMVETEIWPNLYNACQKRDIPILLINARLKQQSFEAYQKWGGSMIQKALSSANLIAAQTQEDAQRFSQLSGYQANIEILGNLKSDIEIDPALMNQAVQWRQDNQVKDRTIWVAASTHAHPKGDISEEQLLIDTHKKLLKSSPKALLILVPRHQARFNEVEKQLIQSGLNFEKRTSNTLINPNTQVYLADTLGEMMLWYAIADIAFVGGSLVPFGGHNILEPAALSKPVISGPHFDNLTDMFSPFLKTDSIKIVKSSQELEQQLNTFSHNPEEAQKLGHAAANCFKQQTGALDKTLSAIESYL